MARPSAGRFTGHAAVFKPERTAIGDPESYGFFEQIHPLTFERALRDKHDVRLLVNHDPNYVLARTANGSLNLKRDARGLVVDAQVADTQPGRDLVVLVEHGDVSQMSFGFEVLSDTWESLPGGAQLRTIKDVRLFDVSPVTYPAYESTDASIVAQRGSAEWVEAQQRRLAAQQRLAALSEPQGGTTAARRTSETG